MKNSKIINIFVSLMVVVCLIFTTAYAAFPDVPADKYSWAVEAINSMADVGIIKGYEDGSFQPEKSISKLEGLVLVARVLGCNASENDIFNDEAQYIASLVPSERGFLWPLSDVINGNKDKERKN